MGLTKLPDVKIKMIRVGEGCDRFCRGVFFPREVLGELFMRA